MTQVIVTLLLTSLFLPLYIRVLLRMGKVQLNYKNEPTPISFGLFIVLLEWFMMILLNQKEFFYFWALFSIVIIGTYDDLFGDKQTKGFKGHFYALSKGIITSGLIKAVGTALLSLIIAIHLSEDMISIVSNFLILVLMTNTMNLFDLRPGRALKVYFFLFLLLVALSPVLLLSSFVLIQISIFVVVFFYDIRAKIMLGDSGSNLLGFQLGLLYAMHLPVVGKWFLIIGLTSINIYSERYSISRYIDQHRWLRSIDEFGRKGIG